MLRHLLLGPVWAEAIADSAKALHTL
jgi:hypothetical protein